MPRTKLTGKAKQNFIKAKVWWATGDVGTALLAAISDANKFMSIEIREKAKNAIKGRSRPDSMPFPRDKLAKTTGQFTKNSVARPRGKPPKYYRKNSLHKILWDEWTKKSRTVSFKNAKGTRMYRVKPYITGPIRGMGVNPKYKAGGVTVARKVELGGKQMRQHRAVPAIKQRGKRNATWDYEWRQEFAGLNYQKADKLQVQRMRYIMLAEKGWIPWQKTAEGKRDYKGVHVIPWQKTMVHQPKKPYMILGRDRALKRKRKILNKAKNRFPQYARQFVKFSEKKGFYI